MRDYRYCHRVVPQPTSGCAQQEKLLRRTLLRTKRGRRKRVSGPLQTRKAKRFPGGHSHAGTHAFLKFSKPVIFGATYGATKRASAPLRRKRPAWFPRHPAPTRNVYETSCKMSFSSQAHTVRKKFVAVSKFVSDNGDFAVGEMWECSFNFAGGGYLKTRWRAASKTCRKVCRQRNVPFLTGMCSKRVKECSPNLANC